MAHILVIDDNIVNLKLTSCVLEQAGHTVLTAVNGELGIDLALHTPTDLVLLDVLMPGMDGITTLRRLRSNPQTALLKVIALSALRQQQDAPGILAAGFDGYCEKPVHYKKLLLEVESTLHANRGATDTAR